MTLLKGIKMRTGTLEFIKEIPDVVEHFDEEERFIIELIGLDKFLVLYDRYQKSGIFFSTIKIIELKKTYCALNRKVSVKELALKLKVSPKTIYRWRNEDA